MKANPIVSKDVGEPTTPLGRIAQAMFSAGENHAEAPEDLRAIVLLYGTIDDSERGMSAHSGYDDELEALADLFVHLQKLAAAGGKRLDLLALDTDGATKIEAPDPWEEE